MPQRHGIFDFEASGLVFGLAYGGGKRCLCGSRPGAFRAPSWVPPLFALAAFAVAINQIVSAPRESLAGLSFVLLGAPVYWLWARRVKEVRG